MITRKKQYEIQSIGVFTYILFTSAYALAFILPKSLLFGYVQCLLLMFHR